MVQAQTNIGGASPANRNEYCGIKKRILNGGSGLKNDYTYRKFLVIGADLPWSATPKSSNEPRDPYLALVVFQAADSMTLRDFSGSSSIGSNSGDRGVNPVESVASGILLSLTVARPWLKYFTSLVSNGRGCIVK
mmetsp:Transcript_71176/g.190017  ORF Transcript_71176/g.190017 Transcript_71176/m.190017 type:complete len:135 (+) Transcript_71176:482-886(+)